MRHVTGRIAGVVLLAAACSIINSPEDLQPLEGGAGDGSGNGSGAGNAGSSTGGGGATGNHAGTGNEAGAGGCGEECSEGGAPPIGRDCAVSTDDCGSTAPICDAAAGTCRGCGSNRECSDELDKDYCVMNGPNSGRCVNCRTDMDCGDTRPVCSALGNCRACAADRECESGACDLSSGACGSDATVVYALAQTGLNTDSCGTLDAPCRNLSDAAAKLTAERSTLVLIETTVPFDSGDAVFPALKGLRVVGNGNRVEPLYGTSGFIVPAGAEVAFHDVVIAGSTAESTGGIQCTGGAISVQNSTLENNGNAILATDCDVTVDQCLIQNNNVPLEHANAALNATCTLASCAKKTIVTRSRFIDNGVALYFSNQAEALLENNLFLRNGADGYTRVLELRADLTRLRYNTLVENFNGCTYVGIVACVGSCLAVGNISHDNFPGETCQDQVWYGATLAYNLTEIAQPGAGNEIGDPLFVNPTAGDYTPGAGSPALDAGAPTEIPQTDILGNPRPGGAGPDIGAFEAQ